MRILLSIKPEFVEQIFAGTKKYEFRKSPFKGVKTVIIYATAPVQRVVGEFEIEEVLSGGLDEIWNKTKEHSGISEEFYKSYYEYNITAHAIKIGKVTKYEKPRFLDYYDVIYPPQSFYYVD